MSSCYAVILVFLMSLVDLSQGLTKLACNETEKCTTSNSICYNNSMCLCDDGFIAKKTNKTHFHCIKAAQGFGDVCEHHIQCEKPLGTLGVCRHRAAVGEGTCECKYGAHHKDGSCYETARIGDRCKFNNNCLVRSKQIKAYCFQRHCICPPGYHSVNNGTDCYQKSKLNGPCSSDEACAEYNAICRGICLCKTGFVLSRDQTQCLVAANKIGDECVENVQCTEYLKLSSCQVIRQRCVCKEKTAHERDGQCYQSVGLNGTCSEKNECMTESGIIDSVDCIGNICSCAEHYVPIGQDCVQPKPLENKSNKSVLPSWSILFLSLCYKFNFNQSLKLI